MAGRANMGEERLPMTNEGRAARSIHGAKKAGVLFWDDAYRGRAHAFLDQDIATACTDNADAYNEESPCEGEYDKYGCPNIWGNAEMARLWEYRFWWTHLALFVCYMASWVTMAALYGATREISGCVHITHDMLSYDNYTGNATAVPGTFQLVPTEERVGSPDLFWFLLWPSVLMSIFHAAFTFSPHMFYNWYHLSVRHEQAAIKYFYSATPFFFIVLVLGTIVGISDIFLLIGLAILGAITEVCMGFMEWYNSNRMRQFNKSFMALKGLFTEQGAAEWFNKAAERLVAPQVEWAPLWICLFSELMVFGTLVAFFAYGMDQNSGAYDWWVVGSISVYFACKGLELVHALGYWWNIYPFICYVYTEWLHLFGRFAAWMLITWFVLSGYGKRNNGEACLYPFVP